MKKTIKLDASQYDEFNRPLGMNAEGEIEFFDSPEEIPPQVIRIVGPKGSVATATREKGKEWVVEPAEGSPPWED
jgi:hypothetical protein